MSFRQPFMQTFLTSYQEFAMTGYEVAAYRYLVKNQPEHVYRKHFRSILEEYFQKHQCFEICDRAQKIYIPLADICYFEVMGRKITVHTREKSYEYVGKLADIEEKLKNDTLFVKVHKSFLVNVAQIDTIYNGDIRMKNNKQVLMGRKWKQKVTDKYVAYMAGR